MTTLQSIAFTLAGGSCVTVLSLVGFGLAVAHRHPYIATRCTARHPNTIYCAAPSHSCQDRGSPTFGWIGWTLGLTYDTMLRGVPGTGTRDGGMAGSLLAVKLDGIVLLRFHTVAAKVAALATVLLLCIILPAYTTGQCHRFNLASEDGTVSGCVTTAYNVSNYERTTIANVPSIPDIEDASETLFVTQNGTLGRLYAVVLVMWIVTVYFLYCLKDEWVQILAMRRVYYLESDIWEQRCAELRNTLLHDEIQRRERKKKARFTFDETKTDKEANRHLIDRDPWIPHPEQRDTVPNIALYSVLVGGLPSLPEQAVDPMNGGDAITLTQRDSIDWQLALTAAFFDHCVPNQPGFSSSVAAVSIMPSSQAIAVAWRRWYKAARRLRRLRFIRDQIAKRRHYDIVLDTPEGEGLATAVPRQPSTRGYVASPWFPGAPEDGVDVESPPPIYTSQEGNLEYYREVLGSVRDQDAERQAYEAFKLGPEQTAVYSREFAQSSAACCPRGCFEGSIRRAKIDELIQMEQEAAEAVHQANLALLKARRLAVRWDDNHEHDQDENQNDGDPEHILDAGAGTGEAQASADMHPAAATPAPKSAAQSPPSVGKKDPRHRRVPTSWGSVQYPENLGLEAELVQKVSEEMNRSIQGDSNGTATLHRRRQTAPDGAQLAIDVSTDNPLDNSTAHPRTNDHLIRDLFKGDSSTFDSSSENQKETKHRRKTTLESMVLPDNLGLEADIIIKAAGQKNLTKPSDRTLIKSSSTTAKPPSSQGEAPVQLIDLETPKIGNLESAQDKETSKPAEKISTDDAADLEACEERRVVEQATSQWKLVESIVESVSQSERSKKRTKKPNVWDGKWNMPSFRKAVKKTTKTAKTGATKVVKEVRNTAINALDIKRESSYAVVTFTSRQAAVAARHCLSDGRGTDRWIAYSKLPIPPLADAASGEILACRNCCKPVTLSITDRQKDYRKFCALALLATIYIFYTIPLTAASKLVDPESIEEVFPKLSRWAEENWGSGAELISGLLQSSIWTLFFAICPVMFRAISNFGSGATSAADAEYKALIYFWYFMTISAFSTTLVSNMFLNGLNNGRLGGEFREVIREIARTIPSVLAVTWLNWIIFRFTILLPVNYLLNLPAFAFSAINFKCCARVVMGGGPGQPTPYRIYVDSGIVLLCLMALAPASPIVAPACFVYFLMFQPILRRNLIFMYRPKFDGGGFRWPFIFDMCIACCVAGEILLTTQMILKQAAGPAIAAAIPMLPTILYHRAMKRRYLRAFEDAALLQTSLLDGWDNFHNEETSMEKREEFRRFLVDAHKAAYIPVCIAAGEDEEGLTAEPAVVVPLETDVQKDLLEEPLHSPYQSEEVILPQGEATERRQNQHGATFRRAVNSLAALRRRGDSSTDSGVFSSMRDLNIVPGPSPFARPSFSKSASSIRSAEMRAAFLRMNQNPEKDE